MKEQDKSNYQRDKITKHLPDLWMTCLCNSNRHTMTLPRKYYDEVSEFQG